MCGLLGVSASGYYAWQGRAPCARDRSDAALLERIRVIHRASRGTYGAPRIHAELADEGTCVGRKRVARLMRAAGLAGVSRRKGVRTTLRAARGRPAPDLVERDFTTDAPDRLWVADITYSAPRPGWTGVHMTGMQ
ncbi:MAG: IS3 family transposase, partial [Kiloniellaceae bacterium]